MRKRFEAGLSGLALVTSAGCAAVQSLPAGHSPENAEVVHVAAPTGEQESDRASIQAAVEQVEAGGTIQFAPGTYLIGPSIRIQVARLTLRGHPQGTTLRGCDPDEFATYGLPELSENCDGLRLLAGYQSVHDLTFEYAFTGLYLGLWWETGDRAHRTEGGDRIMNNTFRTGKGVVLDGDWPEPSVIRNNRFINNYHAVNIFGATAHVLDNHFSVPEPERVPIAGFPDEAIRIFPRVREAEDTLPAVCGRNVVAGNRIEGALIGIEIRVQEADTSCEGNVIRDNWIAVTPARVPEWSSVPAPDDSRIVYGLALALNDLAAVGSGAESDAAAPRISGNVIEGNRIIGGPGPAIQLYGAAGNRIVDNTITGVRLRETYPGHTLYLPPPGTDANGSGIWISHGSDDNEILGNTFEDVASYALVIEGDSNRVTVRDASDAVRDLGRGNQVSGPGGEPAEAPGSSAAKPDEPPYEEKFVDGGAVGQSPVTGGAPEQIDDGWRTAAPAEVGMAPSRLAALTRSLRGGEHGNVHAVLIENDGRLVYEEYFTGEDQTWGSSLGTVTFGRASLHDVRSAAKSVVSTLIGIAIGDGEIPSVEARLRDLLPEYAALLDGEKAELRLRHVLSMSAGLEWDEWSQPYSNPQNDWQQLTRAADAVAFLLDRELVHEPGSTFTYNTGLTYLLAEILERATGERVDNYARRVLFEPLGIRDVVWLGRIGGRTPPADAGLRLRARDLAKIGSLFLNGGRWNGRQIVPEPWVAEAPIRRVVTPPLEPVPDFGLAVAYGYQWWSARYATAHGEVDVHIMLGNGQQRVMVVPELALAVTMFAGHYDDPSAELGWMPDRLLVSYVIDSLIP